MGRKEKAKVLKPDSFAFETPKDFRDTYLINHTRKFYINLGKVNKADDWGFIASPLPLLTACGNGLGGGDYVDMYPDYDKCGLWAFDVIEFSGGRPSGYSEEKYNFIEKV